MVLKVLGQTFLMVPLCHPRVRRCYLQMFEFPAFRFQGLLLCYAFSVVLEKGKTEARFTWDSKDISRNRNHTNRHGIQHSTAL